MSTVSQPSTGRRRWHPLVLAAGLLVLALAAALLPPGLAASGLAVPGLAASGLAVPGLAASGLALWLLVGATAGFATSGST